MRVFRGIVERIEGDDEIILRTSPETVQKVNELLDRFQTSIENQTEQLNFRLDIENSYSIMGTLRRNLVDLLSKDKEIQENAKQEPATRSLHLQRRFSRHRELIIRLKQPVFNDQQAANMFNPPGKFVPPPSCDPLELAMEFAGMNGDQRAAAEKVRFVPCLHL